MRLRDPPTGREVRALKGHRHEGRTVCAVRAGDQILPAAGSRDTTARLRDPAIGRCMLAVPIHHQARAMAPASGEAGGNIDCKELVAGSVLYLPVNVPGALVYLGDGHGAQGDGEACGTAVECPMTTTVAMGDALDAIVTWIAALRGTSRGEALALASVCADLRITQVANGTWGAHALLPSGPLS